LIRALFYWAFFSFLSSNTLTNCEFIDIRFWSGGVLDLWIGHYVSRRKGNACEYYLITRYHHRVTIMLITELADTVIGGGSIEKSVAKDC
jgi:hypothetical protein